MNIREYIKVQSLAEAYELNQKKSSVVLGGCCWLRLLPNRLIGTAIDLSGLGLDQIEDTDSGIRLGCMTTLRQMETSPALADLTQGALQSALRHIVGVQFRNLATVGGSICGRFGFSDIWTLFLVLDADVELYHAGLMKLREFADMGTTRDILTHVILPKQNRKIGYESLRLSETDFPVISCAAAISANGVDCAIGARPQLAELVPGGQHMLQPGLTEQTIAEYARHVADSLHFGTNLRGSAAYRKDMAAVLCRRVLTKLAKGESR